MSPASSPNSSTVTLARSAMATRFELVLHGASAVRLQGAGEAALAEIERIEAQLSLYRPTSEIARVNTHAAREPVKVSPEVFQLLEQARSLHEESGGLFDITIAPLMKCWGFMQNSGRLPDPAELEAARACIGMQHVRLDSDNYTVYFDHDGVMLDLGALGKGYAIDRAVEILRDAGIENALIHGGTSTVYALGCPPNTEAWRIAIDSDSTGTAPKLAHVPLSNEALSVSAIWGRSFEHAGALLGHILDPRSGRPVSNATVSAVIMTSAAETDAFSTALLVGGVEFQAQLHAKRPKVRSLVVSDAIHACGIEVVPPENSGKSLRNR